MKKFDRIKTLEEIKAQCLVQGVPLNDHMYRTKGCDSVVVGHTFGTPMAGGHALYNTFNGCFYGKTPEGIDFDSRSSRHESEPWFQQLLSFFYVEKVAA